MEERRLTGILQNDMVYLNRMLNVDTNFDVIYRTINIGGREACMYLVDGFCKDELMQKMLENFMEITPEQMPKDMHGLSKKYTPYLEVDMTDACAGLIQNLLSDCLSF